jgi:hypothetical protein
MDEGERAAKIVRSARHWIDDGDDYGGLDVAYGSTKEK